MDPAAEHRQRAALESATSRSAETSARRSTFEGDGNPSPDERGFIGEEEATFAAHRPAGWDAEQHDVVVRRRTENGQGLLVRS